MNEQIKGKDGWTLDVVEVSMGVYKAEIKHRGSLRVVFSEADIDVLRKRALDEVSQLQLTKT